MKHATTGCIALALAAAFSTPVSADDSVDIRLLKGPRYEADGYVLGARELEGYLGALKEDDGVTEVVLVGADVGGDEGEQLFAKAARRAGLRALRKEGGSVRELE
jgi:hypothetical protein